MLLQCNCFETRQGSLTYQDKFEQQICKEDFLFLLDRWSIQDQKMRMRNQRKLVVLKKTGYVNKLPELSNCSSFYNFKRAWKSEMLFRHDGKTS